MLINQGRAWWGILVFVNICISTATILTIAIINTIIIIDIVIIIHIVIIKTRAAKEDVNIMDCTHLAPLTVELLAVVA